MDLMDVVFCCTLLLSSGGCSKGKGKDKTKNACHNNGKTGCTTPDPKSGVDCNPPQTSCTTVLFTTTTSQPTTDIRTKSTMPQNEDTLITERTTITRITTPKRQAATPRGHSRIPQPQTNIGAIIGITLTVGLFLGVIIFILFKLKRLTSEMHADDSKHIYKIDHVEHINPAFTDNMSLPEGHQHYYEIAYEFDMEKFDNHASRLEDGCKKDSSKDFVGDNTHEFVIGHDTKTSATILSNTLKENRSNYRRLNPTKIRLNETNALSAFTNYELAKPLSAQSGIPGNTADGLLVEKSNNYAVLDPNETGFNRTITFDRSKSNELGRSISCQECVSANKTNDGLIENDSAYTMLDPNETGFSRTKMSNPSINYDLAQPLSEKNITENQDEYSHTNMTTRCSADISSHHEDSTNIYDHTSETEYDTIEHGRKTDVVNDEYEYFT